MKVNFLGTGTSQGVPIINCNCKVCSSLDPRDKRLRTSVHIQVSGKDIIVDTGPDFRQQVLTQDLSNLDAVLYTHQHKDHIAGLDDVRGFNFSLKKNMPVYASSQVISQLKKEYAYIFEADKYPGIPKLDVHQIENRTFEIEGIKIIPIKVWHYKLPIFGFRIKDFTYITDAKTITDEEMKKIAGTKVLVINALQHEPHISHFTYKEALHFIKKISPRVAYLTHISHRLGSYIDVSRSLPHNVKLAYDGLQISI